jgi:DNA-binding transcriptional regulator YdaS (Cro superfamily)
MTRDEAVQHFGSQHRLAQALGIKQASVSLWGEAPPPIRQLQIEALTGGALRAGPDCDRFRVPSAQPAQEARDAA